jgi:hypothetical protein
LTWGAELLRGSCSGIRMALARVAKMRRSHE